ncbi:hypothetical protein ACFPN2_19270 [Steroidobacter flavus]|uniref:Uncharacterized protein n=1 Tax=Steroidobacter flavus TaxID=1842136 RepID=A0ABV8SUE6_9GAMM
MAEAKIHVPTIETKSPARSYNQEHRARKPTSAGRRVSVYVSWSFPGEANRNLAELDNRFSTMTEVRRVEWPAWEGAEWSSPLLFQQGIAGALELFFRAWIPFQQLVGEVTGHAVPVFQRVDQAGYRLPLDERVLGDADTLFIFGLDHNLTQQDASAEEIEALRQWLSREGTCLVLGPHHDVGASEDRNEREMEYAHHGDALVPREQRFGRYTRSLMQGLGVPVENRYGLRPGVIEGTRQIAPLTINRDLDTRGWLEGVTNFSFHKHLPHYEVTANDANAVRVLARQPIDLSKPHPFTAAGNREFNTLVWMPPAGSRAGEILVVDSTVFSTLFGADDSVKSFWKNLVRAREC